MCAALFNDRCDWTKKMSCHQCSRDSFGIIRPYPGFDGVDLVECHSCGLMQAKPMPSDEFLTNYYQKTFGNRATEGFEMTERNRDHLEQRATMQFNFVKKICLDRVYRKKKEQLSVLDVGCHAGSVLNQFKKRGWDVVGVDPNPRSQYGEKWFGIKVHQTLFKAGMFPENSFNGILHSHTLEHVREPRKYLEEFYKILKPGGWVFIEVPNETREKIRTKKVIPHLYFFSPKTLANLGNSVGFEVVCTKVLGINALSSPLWSKAGRRWLSLRSRARRRPADVRGNYATGRDRGVDGRGRHRFDVHEAARARSAAHQRKARGAEA